jgi:DNA-binding SARP family transcriptional activator/Tol biopolymer transport system component
VAFKDAIMVELRVLGALRLGASDRRDVEKFVHQSKRVALLAYLAAAVPRGPHRRDKLLALFWPELDEPRARAALNQAVYVLRATLGEPAFSPRGDGAIELNGDVVWCDAVAFEAALDGGRAGEALELYRGDLLDGFFISGAPEFEHWLDGERERLRRRASDGAWALAEAKAAEGNAYEAARWARQAAELSPADEAGARRLMTFLHGLGDRGAAIRAYEALTERLAHEYDLEPSGETQALAAAIRDEPQRAPVNRPVKLFPARFTTALAAAQRRMPVAWLVATALAVTGLIVGTWVWLRRSESTPPPVIRFALEFAGVQPMASGVGGPTIAMSPDGRRLVYVGAGEQGPQLFLRPLDRVETVAISHTRGAELPFFSPDGEWLGFVSGNTISKVRLAGGPAITVCKVTTNVSGASWGPNDVIVFATPTGLWQVRAGGGDARILARDTARGEQYRWPEILPDGRSAVFTRVTETGFQLAAVSLETGTVLPLGIEGTNPHFVTAGDLLFARQDGALLAARFDPNALRITGPARPVSDGVQVGIAGAAKLGVSRGGTLAYFQESSGNRTLAVVDRSGHAETIPVPIQGFGSANFSADGRQVVTDIAETGGDRRDIWVLDLARNTFRRVTFDSGSLRPIWSPDGHRIAFGSKPGGRPFGWGIRWIQADGVDSAETLVPGDLEQFPGAFTPDGQGLVFSKRDLVTGRDIWVLPLAGERKPRPYLRTPYDEEGAAVSPDGRWLAYVSNESGQDEVYVRAFPRPGSAVLVSAGGGREPHWAPSGRELFYRNQDGMVVAAVHSASSFRVGRRTVLFNTDPYVSSSIQAAYDVHPDGRRFLMVRREGGAARAEVVVVVLNSLAQQGLAQGNSPGQH